jgi:adenylate kinase family enzyme
MVFTDTLLIGSKMQPQNVLLIGAPGSGRRTQAWNLERDHCFCNINLSSVFRNTIIKYNEAHKYQSPHNATGHALQQESGLPTPRTEAPLTSLKPRASSEPLTRAEKTLGETVKNGGKIDDDLMIQIVVEHAEKCRSKGFVLHGLPRSTVQAQKVSTENLLDF